MGEFYSLLSAVIWALAVILFKRSGEVIAPFALNLFRVVVSSILLVLTLLIFGDIIRSEATGRDYIILFLSGIIAIAISDTFFHYSLNIVGAGISAIVDCLYSPFVVLFAFIMINERCSAINIAGMGLIVISVFIAARHKPPEGISMGKLIFGVFLGVISMATLAFGIVIAKPVLDHSPVLWATTFRQIGCLSVMIPTAMISKKRGEIFSIFKPSSTWKYSLTGAILGSYLALIFWIAGMKYTNAGTAAILNQTTTIHILIFASLFLHESFTRRKLLAVTLSVPGIILVLS